MEAIQSLMQNLLAIGETTPYHCKITASSKTDYQCLDGDVTFHVENGILTFDFFPENDVPDKESSQLFAIASQEDAVAILNIPSQDFEYSVQILSPPHRGVMTAGIPINSISSINRGKGAKQLAKTRPGSVPWPALQ